MSNTTLNETLLNTPGLLEKLLQQNGRVCPKDSRLRYGATVELVELPIPCRLSFLAILIEASRCKEGCSQVPFYAERAAIWGDLYWIEDSGSYGSFGLDAEDIRFLKIAPEVLNEIVLHPQIRTELGLPSLESSTAQPDSTAS